MTIDWFLIFRLVAAGLLGGLIGMEREFRAKEAGVRTHFIVALGSALFMIISQYAFVGHQHDAARVAAQVVSGIGFIGAGVIIFQKNAVRGITTAAGIWVAGAIGLAAGAGMHALAVSATLLTIAVLEMMHFLNLHYSEKIYNLTLVPVDPSALDPIALRERFNKLKTYLESFSVTGGKVYVSLRVRQKNMFSELQKIKEALPDFRIEELS